MDEEIFTITESYEASTRHAIINGLHALECSVENAANRIEQEPSSTNWPHFKLHIMYWLKGKSSAEKRQPICLVTLQWREPIGHKGKGGKVQVYYGRWAEYVFKPMQTDESYSFIKPYEL